MLPVDVLTAFVICGAASCVAAVMMALPRPDEPHLRGGLRICSAGFAVLGVSLFQIIVGAEDPSSPTMFVALTGSSLGVTLFAWGLARLAGQRVRQQVVHTLLAAIAAAHAVAWWAGGWALSHTFVGAMTFGALLNVAALRGIIARPSGLAERILGLAMIGFAASCLMRGAWTVQYSGPLLTHHLHVPAAASGAFAVFYGVMPIFLATVVLNVINARLTDRLALRALTDELTGAMTRRALRELGPQLLARRRQSGGEIAVLMLDIDHFKAVNDQHGHRVGDDVLRQLAEVARSQLRPDALLTRYGGEEFAALVPVADIAGARQVAERLREAVATCRCHSGALTLRVTCSIGVALIGPREALDAALNRADEALYRAKRGGRDRVEASLDVVA